MRRPPFRRLALSYAVNELGDWLGVIALSVLVFDQTDSALATAALFIGTGFLPALLTPILVTRLERPPPRFVLPAIYAGEAAAFGILALLADNFSLAAIVVVATIDGALALTARALIRSVTAAMLEPEGELRAGNAILNIAFTGGSAAGPIVAGAVIGTVGVQTALLLDAFSFYVIAWILLAARPLPQAELEPGRLVEQVKAGVLYIRHHRVLGRLLSAQAIAFVFFAAVIPIEVIYAKDTLGVGDSGYGLLLGSWGGGMVIGSIVFATLRRAHLQFLLLASMVAIGAGYLGMAAAQSLAVACLTAALGGIGNGVQWVTLISAVQELTARGMQARVIAVLESLAKAMPGLGFLLGGLIATATGTRQVFVVAGVGVLVVVVATIALLRGRWPAVPSSDSPIKAGEIQADEEIMVQLIPGGARYRMTRVGSETAPFQSRTEVER